MLRGRLVGGGEGIAVVYMSGGADLVLDPEQKWLPYPDAVSQSGSGSRTGQGPPIVRSGIE